MQKERAPVNQKAKVKSGPVCRSGESGSGILPDSLSEPSSAFACVVEKFHQNRMGETSLNNLSLRALPCGRKGSCPTTRGRCTHVPNLIKYTLFFSMHTWMLEIFCRQCSEQPWEVLHSIVSLQFVAEVLHDARRV